MTPKSTALGLVLLKMGYLWAGIFTTVIGAGLLCYAVYCLAQIIVKKNRGDNFDEPNKLDEVRKNFIFMDIKPKKNQKPQPSPIASDEVFPETTPSGVK